MAGGWRLAYADRLYAKGVDVFDHSTVMESEAGTNDPKVVGLTLLARSALPPGRLNEPDVFEQIWFAGNHADIGGSYPETESRLSDISLQWMVDFITKTSPEEGRVEVDPAYMALCPSPDGMMHDECMVGIGGSPAHWYPADRDVPVDAVLHPTVYERLALPSVRNYTSYAKYRPAPLRNHSKAKAYFEDELKPTLGADGTAVSPSP
jgi:hypothetical protein